MRRQDETGRFAAVEPTSALVESGRAAAFGDYDNDGDLDVLVANRDGPARLLRNDAQRRGGKLNQADIRLNKAARAVAAEILDHRSQPPIAGDQPVPAARYAELLRRHLGPAE